MLYFPESRVPNPREAPALRWGILAPGNIASAFATALRRHTSQRLTAVASRSAERGAAFARAFEIGKVHASYEDLVEDPDVDVVYVASRQIDHREHALLAVSAGKHVLVEKPFATSADEARTIIEAARRARVFVMEAMWTRYLPQMDILRQLLDSSVLGDVRNVMADHGQRIPDDNWRWHDTPGGGALMDLGIYAYSFASSVLGSPASLAVHGSIADTGVDRESTAILSYSSGATAVLSTSLLSRTPTRASISGTDALLEFASPFFIPTTMSLSSSASGSSSTHWSDTSGINGQEGLSYQAAALVRYVDEGRIESAIHPLSEVVSVIAAIDATRELMKISRS